MSDNLKTHYDNLQVKENASIEIIRGAYRYLSQKWHPDKHPGSRERAERIARIINEAYAVLSDPVRRKEHDEWIRNQRAELNSVNDFDEVGPEKEQDGIANRHAELRKPEGLIARITTQPYSLAVSFWILGVLVGNIALGVVVSGYVERNTLSIAATKNGELILYSFYFGVLLYSAFVWVCIWVSARHYQGPKLFSVLAKVTVVIGFIGVLASIIDGLDDSPASVIDQVHLLNKSLPYQIDEVTRFDSASAEDGRIDYHYTLTSEPSHGISGNEFSRRMKSIILKSACQDEFLLGSMSSGWIVRFNYSDSRGVYFAMLTLSIEDCSFNP